MSISRRQLMKNAGKVFIGLVAFAPALRAIYTDLNAHAEDDPVSDVIDEAEGGTIQEIYSDRFVVLNSDGFQKVLYLLSSSRVWKGGWAPNADLVAVGDYALAWGTRRSDGNLDVEDVRVNMALFVEAPVVSSQTGSGTMTIVVNPRYSPTQVSVSVNNQTQITFIDDDGNKQTQPYVDGLLTLATGQRINITGLKLSDGSVRGTDIQIEVSPTP